MYDLPCISLAHTGDAMEDLESRQNQHDSDDPWIDLTSYMSLGVTKIPSDLHPVQHGMTCASSFSAVTGCDPRSGAIASTASLAAIVGGGISRYYLEKIVWKDPEFQFVRVDKDRRAMATYPGSFTRAWNDRRERIKREQLERAGAAAEARQRAGKRVTDVSAGSGAGSSRPIETRVTGLEDSGAAQVWHLSGRSDD